MEKPLKDVVASEAFRGLSRREQFSIRSLAGSGLPLAGEPTVNDLKAWSRVLEAHGGVRPGQSFVGVRAVDRGRGLAPRRGLAGPAFRRPDAAAALVERRPSAFAAGQGVRTTVRPKSSLIQPSAAQLAGARLAPAPSFRAPAWFVDLVHSQAASGRPLWESAGDVEKGIVTAPDVTAPDLGAPPHPQAAAAMPEELPSSRLGQARDQASTESNSTACGCSGQQTNLN